MAMLSAADRRAFLAASSGGRRAYQALLAGPGRACAAEWLAARFDDLPLPAKAEVLSEWIESTQDATLASSKP